jgi:glycosyltransferase involved in cell wall biosynthesis
MPRVTGSASFAIDARAAVRSELGGVERWARELAVQLPALRPGGYAVLRPPRALAHRAGHAWEQVALPLRAAQLGLRALLCPANLAPLAFARNVVVIHDAAPLRHPGWYSPAYAAWQRRVLPAIARRALHVITVSEFSRAELRELLGVERVSVVPGGVDGAFAPDADAGRARAALGLARPYVLCAASHTARKNLAALVPAARALIAEGIEVAVAGGHRPQFAAERGLEDLRLLGHVPDELLPGLYAGAEALALPSLYEGFGLPVLEAMASGTPVVAAAPTALPETCGGAALLVPPDGEAFRDALLALLGDAAERGRLRAAGLERAAGFTWDATARAVDAVVAGG